MIHGDSFVLQVQRHPWQMAALYMRFTAPTNAPFVHGNLADPPPIPHPPRPQVPPEAWGGNVVSLTQVDDFTAYVKANGGAGMMIWSLGKPGSPSPGEITNHMCTGLGLGSCSVPLPT
jgi:hypothetical protein